MKRIIEELTYEFIMSRLYSKVEARVKLRDCLGLVTVKTKIIQTEF